MYFIFWCLNSDVSVFSSHLSPVPFSPPGGVQRVGGVCHDVARSAGWSLRPAGRRDGSHDRLPPGRWEEEEEETMATTKFCVSGLMSLNVIWLCAFFFHSLCYRCWHHHHLLHTSAARLAEGVKKEDLRPKQWTDLETDQQTAVDSVLLTKNA